MPVFDQLTNPNLTLAQAFKRRNLATFKNLAQQKLQALSQNQQTAGAKIDLSQPQDYPMYIEGIRTNTVDPDGHVIFFDTEALIGRFSFKTSVNKFGFFLSGKALKVFSFVLKHHCLHPYCTKQLLILIFS